MPMRRRDGVRHPRSVTRGHRRLAGRPTPAPAESFEDAAFALLLISAAAIADTVLALLIVV